MAMWQCIKCGNMSVTHEFAGRPAGKPDKTPCGRGGMHQWVNADGKVSVSWKCSKCGAVTFSPRHPLIGFCPKGNGHTWRKG